MFVNYCLKLYIQKKSTGYLTQLSHLSEQSRFENWPGIFVLCCWASHCVFTVPFSTQVYKWVLRELNAGGNPTIVWQATVFSQCLSPPRGINGY